jgi:hypothetical protein
VTARALSARALSARALAAVIAAVAILLAVAGCGDRPLTPDPAACKAALQAQYLETAAGKAHPGTEPAICKGLPAAQVRRFALQIQTGT